MNKYSNFWDDLVVVLHPPPYVQIEQIQQACSGFSKKTFEHLEAGPIALKELNKSLEEEALPEAYFLLQYLWKLQALALTNQIDSPYLQIRPSTIGTTFDLRTTGLDGMWKLSRFAFLRLDSDSELRIETPKHPVIVDVLNPEIGQLFTRLAKSVTAQELVTCFSWINDLSVAYNLLLLLRISGVIDSCDSAGIRDEDQLPKLQQWEFHDLLFHHRSRKGRHSEPLGASYRFKDQLPAPPATKKNLWAKNAIPLPRPDFTRLMATDPSFTAVLENRLSLRDHDASSPISIHQLGEFLYRTARIRERKQTSLGEFTSRPYPSGGGSYELELYISVNMCMGLKRGLYYYDAESHALCIIHEENANLEAILDEAWLSAARLCRPQILITVASRFHRVSWKYSSIAYATQLKNVGALYQTFYLVATAMNLAGCALGLGNPSRLGEMADLDFFEEGSIGEFMLGTSK